MLNGIMIIFLSTVVMSIFVSTIYAGDINWIDSLDAGLNIAKQDNKPIMVDFYTDWCGWCKKLDQDTYSNSNIKELASNFVCVKVDGDKDRASISRYGIDGYPTIVFLDATGEEMDRNVGYAGPDELANIMNRILELKK